MRVRKIGEKGRVIFFALCILMVSACARGTSLKLRTGIERYEVYKTLLCGKRVGIVTNHTSRVREQHSVDFLLTKGVDLKRIYAPEHGFRGDIDAGRSIGDYMDPQTGLPVISLYGKKRKPTAEDLEGIEVMLFDIQDVGVRFYTYISTLHYVMEACAEHGIPLILTDRPNPNAFYVDGPVMKERHRSFVGMHPVPVVYGMTIGEYARMINGEGWLKDGIWCDMTVVNCENWERDKPIPLPIAPSPNLPDSISVMLYPSTCLFEGTVVNEGRGTYTPFQVFGHPDLSGMPYSYTPRSIPGMSTSPKCLGRICYGMDLRDQYETISVMKRLNLEWLLRAYQSYHGMEPFFTPYFELLIGDERVREAIQSGKTEVQIRSIWSKEVSDFLQIRSKYLTP